MGRMHSVAIAPDANGVAAAGIIDSAGGTNAVKHVFYDESIQMFSLFEKSAHGYAVPRVRLECHSILLRAVKDACVRSLGAGRTKDKAFYRDVFRIANLSDVRMRKLIARLETPSLDSGKVMLRLAEVRQMSRDLRGRYTREYSNREWREREAKARAGSVMTDPDWRSGHKREAYRMYMEQIVCESRQLARFVGGYPNSSDQRILAEVAVLRDMLAADGTPVMIASLDMGFFSPHYSRGCRSDTVTEEIRRRFGIVCARPRAVFLMAGGTA